LNVYDSGSIRYYSHKLYLNREKFDEVIELKNVLNAKDLQKLDAIKINKIPKCITLYNRETELKENSFIGLNDQLNYKSNSHPCSSKDNLKFATVTSEGTTINDYEISVEVFTPSFQPSTEVEVSSSNIVEIFKKVPLDSIVRRVIFKNFTNGVIKYKSNPNEELKNIEFDKEYDTNNQFFLQINEKEINPTIIVPIITKDTYGFTSDIINLKFIFINTAWYQRWYSILAFVSLFLVVVFFATAFKFNCENSRVEARESFKSCAVWMKKKCCFCIRPKIERPELNSLLQNSNIEAIAKNTI
jgi:hypothetical protein